MQWLRFIPAVIAPGIWAFQIAASDWLWVYPGCLSAGGTIQTWLILPVVICLSQRLSHASLSTSLFPVLRSAADVGTPPSCWWPHTCGILIDKLGKPQFTYVKWFALLFRFVFALFSLVYLFSCPMLAPKAQGRNTCPKQAETGRSSGTGLRRR